MNATERDRLYRLFETSDYSFAAWDRLGRLEARDDAIELHLARILSLPELDLKAIRRRKPCVVVDAGNGAGSVISPELLRRLGCQVLPIFCELDGRFSRSPEPSGESLHALRETVVRKKAEVGFAHDSDADRLVLVDEGGRVVPEEYTFALAADVVLRRNRRPVVTTVVTGGLLDEVARRYGVPVLRTPVGVGHVVERMRAVDAAVGGESTGGVIVPGTHLTTDGIAAIALILSGLASDQASLSGWMARWNVYHLRKAKIPLPPEASVEAVLDALVAMYPETTVDRIDGLKFVWEDAWVSVRPSGTEPVLRVFAESPDASRAESLVKQTVAHVESVLASGFRQHR